MTVLVLEQEARTLQPEVAIGHAFQGKPVVLGNIQRQVTPKLLQDSGDLLVIECSFGFKVCIRWSTKIVNVDAKYLGCDDVEAAEQVGSEQVAAGWGSFVQKSPEVLLSDMTAFGARWKDDRGNQNVKDVQRYLQKWNQDLTKTH